MNPDGKKLAIITLFGCSNYGNRLQNYAVQKIFEQQGLRVETLDFYPSRIRRLLQAVKMRCRWIAGAPEAKRYYAFCAFNRAHVPVRSVYAPNGQMPPKMKEQYDFFCVGSDQVWNPEIRQKQRDILFLRFAEERQRLCIAPSIGVSRIPEQYEEAFRQYFQGFPKLSCREDAGAAEIKRLSGKECVHLLDPTLVLKAEAWRALPKNGKEQGDYAVVFFLGSIPEGLDEKIQNFCERNRLARIEPSKKTDPSYAMPPDDFVRLLDGAKLVLTDSFHAAAFSINLNTPFYVFDRKGSRAENNHTASRISSLVELFGLRERYNPDVSELDCCVSFEASNRVLERERRCFRQYIEEILKDA